METVSIIIPAYNEEKGIGKVLAALQSLPLEKEIIVVDDGSTDATAAVAAAAGVRVVRRAGNIGYGRSIKDGIAVARHDLIVISDADGTYPIDRIVDLVAKMSEGFDMVVGARQGREYRGSFLKWPARIFFKKQEVQKYMSALCDTFSFTTTLTLSYMLTRHTVTYLPISYGKRIGRSHVRMVRDTLRTLQYIVECIARFNPIKLFILCMLACAAVGALSAFVLGWLGLFLGIFSGLIVFAIGIHSTAVRS
jgi:polyisoprenyl-phosphate glycosyltransferase